MQFSLVTVCALLAGAIAAPAPNTRRQVVHERRDRLPVNWERNAKLHGDSFMPLRIALTQSNLHRADEFLMDVSDPDSPNFGKHWTAKQVAETFAPSHETFTSVINWLAEYGISSERVKQSQGLNWVHVNMTVSEAEKLLDAKYYEYKHSLSDDSHIACEEYSVPEELGKHIDFITPTVHFDMKIKKPSKTREMNEDEIEITKRQTASATGMVKSGAQAGTGIKLGAPGDGSLPKPGSLVSFNTILNELENCDVSITPNCLRALYEFPPNFPANAKNSYGIVEYSPQSYLPGDLDLFFGNYSPPLVGSRPIFDSIDGGQLQTIVESFGYNGESDLDLEYAMSLVYPQKVTLYQVGDLLEGASFNNFLDAFDASYCAGDDPSQDGIYPDPYGSGYGVYKGPEACGGFTATKVISTSYAYNEADLTPAYEMRQCNEYLKLGLTGVTFLYSSGDYGVAGNGGTCIDPTTGAYTDGSYGKFNPSFPGTCPYITSVGATQVKPGATVTQPEEAAESVIYSGGGFSNVFPLPSYQASAVKTYFAQHNPPYGADRYNNSMNTRSFPDVSANGVNYVIAVDGSFSYVYGTSASSPTFGSVMTLVNAARLDIGKSAVGFINPTIYKFPFIFNDITEGGNQGCGTSGFQSVSGWDPVTGLGTPNFPKMVATWLALP